MPQRLDRCVEELKRKGYTEQEAWRICTATIGGCNFHVAETEDCKEKRAEIITDEG